MKGIGGPHQFGYNKKVHALHFVFYLPVSVLLAWVCTLLRNGAFCGPKMRKNFFCLLKIEIHNATI